MLVRESPQCNISDEGTRAPLTDLGLDLVSDAWNLVEELQGLVQPLVNHTETSHHLRGVDKGVQNPQCIRCGNGLEMCVW